MIFNMTGGGSGSGATLVVSCPANVTVTVSKDDKSYTKNSGSLGSATFKGLATGEWTVTIEGNEQTATKNITITADYAITMAFFAAYINITYPANSNCVVQNSGGVTVASDTNSTSSTKTWKATVITTGTYTIVSTATDGSGKSKSTTISITADGQSESVALYYTLYLYNQGDQCVDVTGGWETTPEPGTGLIGGTLSFSNGEMVLVGNSDQTRVDASCKSLDSGIWTRFTKLCVHVTYTSGQILAARIVDNLTNKTTIAQVTFSGAGDYNLLLDGISYGQIILLAYMGTLKVTKIWLE